jgi:hypothetical protein
MLRMSNMPRHHLDSRSSTRNKAINNQTLSNLKIFGHELGGSLESETVVFSWVFDINSSNSSPSNIVEREYTVCVFVRTPSSA